MPPPKKHTTTPKHHNQMLKNELDLFADRPIQLSIDGYKWNDLRPASSVTENNPVVFLIAGNEDEFLDPVFYLKMKVTVKSGLGNSLTGDKPVAPVNLFGHALFERIDLRIQDKTVVLQNYPYRAYMERLLTHSAATKQSQLATELYYKDTIGQFDSLDPTKNTGFRTRSQLAEKSRPIHMFVRLSTDIASQPRLLPNLVDMGLTLHQKANAFRLMYDETTGGTTSPPPRVIIDDIALFYRTVKPSNSMAAAILETMRLQPARYPLPFVQMITIHISKEQTLLNRETLSRGQLPRAVVVGIVDAVAFNGHGGKNPFNFQHKQVNSVCLYRDSEAIPSVPFTPNFGALDCCREYLSLFQVAGHLGDNFGTDFSYLEYCSGGHVLFAFDLSADECGSSCASSAIQSGNLSLTMKFPQDGIDETCIAICYLIYDKNVYIDHNRNVVLDFT